MTPPLFEPLVVTCPNIGGGLGVVDGGCFFFQEGLPSTGLAASGGRLLIGQQPNRVVVIEDGRAHVPAPLVEDIHDLAVIDGTIYAVATDRNEILALDRDLRTLQSWRRPGEGDSCHVNCLAGWRGRVVFTMFGDFTEWRGFIKRAEGAGRLCDLHSGECLVDGLNQPHSPVPFRDGLLIANSGDKELRVYDGDLRLVRSVAFEGYVRGVHVGTHAVYVGLSRLRTHGEEGPVNARLLALDPDSFAEIGRLEFPSEEIYAIAALGETLRPLDILAPLSRLLTPGAAPQPDPAPS